jgi:hypothetical protein
MTKRVSGHPNAGEAGHQGQDRQPVHNGAKSADRNPEPEEAASPREVARRSQEAEALSKKTEDGVDYNHPGPDRLDAERSKGNAHHDQRERETDMQKKIEGL